ncbi:MAG: molybdopterin-dependent oxidoreductase [Actinomycetales bacterium]|nr:molybdopterin-dependent oxidoreductase [Actinomycetales bacterium]
MTLLLAALTGVVAMAAGVAVAHLVAAVTTPAASPLVAVGSTFIDLTPTWLKEFAVARFGTADKPILLGSIAVVLVAMSALCGLLARRHRAAACAAAAGVGLVAAAAAVSRPDASIIDALPALLGAAVAASALAWLTRPSHADAQASGTEDDVGSATKTGPDRRSVLLGALVIGAGAAVTGALGTVLGGVLKGVDAARAAIRLPAPADPAPVLAPAVTAPVSGITPFRVPNADFYRVDTALVVPTVGLTGWRLTLGGMVSNPYSLTYDDLLAMPLVERDLTLTCVSNEVGGPYAGNARWLGVRLTDLLDRAGVSDRADQLLSRSVDGFTAGTPMAIATDGRDALVAVGMNGEPLPAEHGFPARLVVPGLYGFVSATKWLTSLDATTYAAEQAYWTQRGWATDAPVRTMARVEVPRPLSTVSAGEVAIGGVAWAQHRAISVVEVQVDDGPWEMARLGDVPSDDTWRQWWSPWRATPGRHTLRARATDGDGALQPDTRLTPFPSGAQGWHEVVVLVA